MTHAIAIWTHTVCAMTALGAGVLVLRRDTGRIWHAGALVAMTAALAVAMASGWGAYSSDPVRLTFLGLGVLALVMVARAVAALRARRSAALEHVGFNVIALVTGGLVVPALRLGWGSVGAIASVAVGVAGTRWFVRRSLARARDRPGEPRRKPEPTGRSVRRPS